jgi:hypothetical protein
MFNEYWAANLTLGRAILTIMRHTRLEVTELRITECNKMAICYLSAHFVLGAIVTGAESGCVRYPVQSFCNQNFAGSGVVVAH